MNAVYILISPVASEYKNIYNNFLTNPFGSLTISN